MTPIVVKRLGRADYLPTWQAMQDFTANRTADTPDELWLLEHPPTYTVGLNGKPEHLPLATDIPIVNIDRGGQITYHGPGQIVIYVLVDLKRLGIGVRELVNQMEEAIIRLLARHGVAAQRRDKAPGVYVGDAKIAALGLRIKNGRSYHGLSLNVDMDLTPFSHINPCGYKGLAVTQTIDQNIGQTAEELGPQLAEILSELLGYTPPFKQT